MYIKITLNALLFCLWIGYASGQSLYDRSLKDISGQPVELAHFTRKKLLFVILPPNSDSMKAAICAFKNKYSDAVQVIGILDTSIAYGSTALLKAFYDDGEPASVLLTEKMQLKGSPHPLFQWLSDPANHHSMFREMFRPGFTFLVNEQGKLLTANPPSVSLSSPFISFFLRGHPSGQ